MKYLIVPVYILIFGCASTSQRSINRQPNEVAQTTDGGNGSAASDSSDIKLSSRYEIPKGSQMRAADVKRQQTNCEIHLSRFNRSAAVGINLNAEIYFRGNHLAGTKNFEIMTTQIPLDPPAYQDGKYTAIIQDPKGAEQRYIVFTDPNFTIVTKVAYEVYSQGKLQLSYLCESDFIGM